MKRTIATHNGIFHADEVTAVALLNVFTDDEIVVERVEHSEKEFDKYDMVIDIGRKYDGEKYFDHHQNIGGKSSAGLIWDYLKLSSKYPQISQLIKIVDENDVGIRKSKSFEYSSLIRCFNTSNINSIEQDKAFAKAVEFSITIIKSMVKSQEELKRAEKIVKESYLFDGNNKILELSKFTPFWGKYINGVLTPHIKAVVWEDENENKYKVKIVSKNEGGFELNNKPFKQDNSMEFVHSNGHFAIAKDYETMRKFLKREIR